MIRKGIMNLEKELLRNVFQRPSEKTRKLCRLLYNSAVAPKTANHPKQAGNNPKPPKNHPKPPETS